jgi:hypothetical protein
LKFAPLKPLPFHEVCRPKHAEVKVGTIRSILRQAGITPEEWDNL